MEIPENVYDRLCEILTNYEQDEATELEFYNDVVNLVNDCVVVRS